MRPLVRLTFLNRESFKPVSLLEKHPPTLPHISHHLALPRAKLLLEQAQGLCTAAQRIPPGHPFGFKGTFAFLKIAASL